MRFEWINVEQMRRDPRVGWVWSRTHGQPSWVWKAAGLGAVVVFVVPLLILAFAAFLAFALIFGVLALVARVVGLLTPAPKDLAGNDDGRRNVRVIDPR